MYINNGIFIFDKQRKRIISNQRNIIIVNPTIIMHVA